MPRRSVFLSVGSSGSEKQEEFVCAIQERLRAEGLEPRTLGRTDWDSAAPLRPVVNLLGECSGAVIVALERTYFPQGTERRGSDRETPLSETCLPTAWNQIEAALAWSMDLPLLVICEHGLKSEGLLENRYDWYVQWVRVGKEALSTDEFNGVLASWKGKLVTPPVERSQPPARSTLPRDPSEMTIADLVGAMKPVHLWSLLGALAAAFVAAFTLGVSL